MDVKCNNCTNQRGEYNISSTASGYWCSLRNNPVDSAIAINCDKYYSKPSKNQ
jgi:hypothetical protein